jgi:diacylglycerol O-acyltransferase
VTAHRATGAHVGIDRLVLERLTPLDVSNLRIERHGLPMNVAALAILEGRVLLDASGELALRAIRVRIEQRLHLAPRLRQRLYRPGFGFGAPVWVDDASFDISRHVRTRPVPAGGGEEALLATCVELKDRPFDQAHPLWEIWLLTGALDGHISMLIRFHHVLADGIAALLLLGTLFDSAPDTPEPEAPPWTARPIPTRSELLLDALRIPITGIRRGLHKIEHPRRTLTPASTFFRQAIQLAREGRAPRTSFNRPVSKQHRVLLVRADLERAKQVAHAHQATVNDVVLCTIAGGARALLAARGELERPLVLKVSVAASVRAATSASQAGNLVGVLLVPVPIGEENPIRRLEQIARATAERKRLPPYQPAARLLQRWMIRAMNRQRRINLLMSNLPGPPQPMYFAGAKILEMFQIGVVQGNVAVQVGALSYSGQLNFDIVADANLVPDLTVFANGMAEDLERLGARPHQGEQRDEAIKPGNARSTLDVTDNADSPSTRNRVRAIRERRKATGSR